MMMVMKMLMLMMTMMMMMMMMMIFCAQEHAGKHETTVTLDLYRAEEWHFDSVYYLDVFVKGGQKFREKATLILCKFVCLFLMLGIPSPPLTIFLTAAFILILSSFLSIQIQTLSSAMHQQDCQVDLLTKSTDELLLIKVITSEQQLYLFVSLTIFCTKLLSLRISHEN